MIDIENRCRNESDVVDFFLYSIDCLGNVSRQICRVSRSAKIDIENLMIERELAYYVAESPL